MYVIAEINNEANKFTMADCAPVSTWPSSINLNFKIKKSPVVDFSTMSTFNLEITNYFLIKSNLPLNINLPSNQL